MTEKHRLGQALTKSDFKVNILILRAYQKYARIFYVKIWFFIKIVVNYCLADCFIKQL